MKKENKQQKDKQKDRKNNKQNILNHNIESHGISPTEIFGISAEEMKGILNGLSVNYPYFIYVSFVKQLSTLMYSMAYIRASTCMNQTKTCGYFLYQQVMQVRLAGRLPLFRVKSSTSEYKINHRYARNKMFLCVHLTKSTALVTSKSMFCLFKNNLMVVLKQSIILIS